MRVTHRVSRSPFLLTPDASCPAVVGRVLFAVDSVVGDRSASETAVALVEAPGGVVRVLHVREGDAILANRYLESEEEAWAVVNEAVFELRFAGLRASGQVVRAIEDHVAAAIAEEAVAWQADAIVLGPGRGRPMSRLSRPSVRRQLQRSSPVMVIATPIASAPPRSRAWRRAEVARRVVAVEPRGGDAGRALAREGAGSRRAQLTTRDAPKEPST